MSGRKNKFSHAMTHLKSSKIDEKIGYLNKEMKKMGVISEQPANSTSDLYCTTEYIPPVPESPAEYTDVPDPDGVRSAEWNQPSNGFDVNDPATWENAFNDFSWLYNPNDVAGETDRPVLESQPTTWDGATAGAGIMLAHVGWGQSLGYLSDGGIYKPLVTAGSMSSSMIPPIQRGSHFDGAHYTYSIPDDRWAAMQGIYAKYEAMIAAGNVATQTIKVWYPWSYFWYGSWESYGGVKRSDYHVLINATLFKKAGDYMSKPHENEIPGRTVVLTQHSLDDPNYYPGNPNGFMDFLRNSLDVGREALDWLMDAAGDLAFQPFDKALDVVNAALDFITDKSKSEIQSDINDFKQSNQFERLATAGRVYGDYLSGDLKDGSINNDYLGQEYVNRAFAEAKINSQGNVRVGDNIVGSGGKPYVEDGVAIIPFEYDFNTNEQEITKNAMAAAKGDPEAIDKFNFDTGEFGNAKDIVTFFGMFGHWVTGGKYGLDSNPIPPLGYVTWMQKLRGLANKTTGHKITMPLEDLKKINEPLYNQLTNQTESFSLTEGWESPKHTYIDKNQQKRWFKEKDIAPVYPKKAPPKMMNGYHPDLLPKLGTEDTPLPQIKVRKKDLLRNHDLKKDQVNKFIDLVDSLNDYIKRNPEHLAYARERYPKHDPRLATLNYKMDMQLAAADEYVEKHFPENKRLLNKVLKATKQSIKLTDPKTFKSEKGVFTTFNKLERARHFDNEYKPKERKVIKKRRGKSVSRFFYKPKKKSKYDILKDKMTVLDNEMKKMTGLISKEEFTQIPVDTKEVQNIEKEKQIFNIPEKREYSWRDTFPKRLLNEIGVDTHWVDIGSEDQPTNSTAQTFGLFTTGSNLPVYDSDFNQVTTTLGGLGGVESLPSSVTYVGMEGESVTVNPPTYDQLAVAGFAKPLGKHDNLLRKISTKKASEINDQLDSSEKVAAKANADVLMKARVEKWMDEYKPGDPVWSNDGIIVWTPANDPYVEPDTYQNYMPKKGIDLEWFRWGGTNMEGRYYRWGGGDASVKAGLTFDQVHKRGIEYANKYMSEKEASGPKQWNFVGPVYDPVKDGKNWNHSYEPPSKKQLDTVPLASAKAVFDYYLEEFLKNPHSGDVDLTKLISTGDIKWLSNFIEKYVDENSRDADKWHQFGDAWNEKVTGGIAGMGIGTGTVPWSLRNILGDIGAQTDEGFSEDEDYYYIRKRYDFTDENDLKAPGAHGKGKIGKWEFEFDPAGDYAKKKGIMKWFNTGKGSGEDGSGTPTMHILIKIPKSRKKKKKK